MPKQMLNKPQKQEPVGVLIEIGLTLYKLFRTIWPLLLFIFLKDSENKSLKSILLLSALVVFVLVLGILRFNAFRFYIDTKNQEFVLQKGILSKEKIIISLDKIIEVNLEQKYLHILLGIYKIKLDTAGSDKDEIVIESLSKADAELLRSYILNYKSELQTANVSTDSLAADLEIDVNENENLEKIKISFLSLIKNSLISNYIKTFGIILLFFNSIYDNIRHFNEEILAKYLHNFNIVQTLSGSISFTVVLFLFLFLFLNLVMGIFQHFGYQIQKKADSILINYGLIQKFQIVVQPKKIQYFVLTTSKLMQALNINTLRLALIGNPEEKKQKSSVVIPALSKIELSLIKDYLKIKDTTYDLLLTIKPNYRMVVKSMFTTTLVLLGIFSYLTYFNYERINHENSFIWIISTIVFIWIITLFVAIINYKRFTIYLFDDRLVVKQGVFKTNTTILPIEKMQAVNQKQMWWHIKNELSRVEIKTAGGIINLPIASQKQYVTLVNYLLFAVESKNQSWA